MIIVLEGCDGTGKSTLAKALCDYYDLKYHHEGQPPTNVSLLEHYGGLFESYRWSIAKGDIKGVVFDRLAMGERVYGPIYRNNERLSADEWRIFRRLITAADAMHVICMPSFEVCFRNWSRRGGEEMIRDPEMLRRIYDRYIQLVKEDPIGAHWIYDYTEIPSSLDLMLSYLNLNTMPLPVGVIGSPRAKYLFIGEQGSKPESATADLPFFGMVSSSGYLNLALQEAGFSEMDIAFTNAIRWDGQNVEWPKSMRWVALGKVAAEACRAQSTVEPIRIPHPQYWKRFHNSRFADYIHMLRRIRDERA